MTTVVWLALAAFVVVAWRQVNTRAGWRAVAVLLALGFSAAHQFLFATVPGEAYVTFRYAEQLAGGAGPVFNHGERVEGYADFLWMAVLAVPRALFGTEVAATAVTLGVLCTLGTVLLAYFVTNRIVRIAEPAGPGLPALGVLAAVLTAGAGSLAAYGASGLGTPLFLLLVLAVCGLLAARRPVVAGVFAAFAMMTRPEGAVLAIVVGGWLLLAALRRRENGWAPAGYALGALVLVVPWTAWRVTYYGYLLPNAVAARTEQGFGGQLADGWHYLSSFAVAYQAFLLLGAAAPAALRYRRGAPAEPVTRARSLVWLLLVLAAGFAGLTLLAGGGELPAWRLLAVVPPLLAVAAAAAYGVFVLAAASGPSPVPRELRLAGRRVLPVVAVGVCALSLLVSITHPRMLSALHALRDDTRELAEIGAWLGERLPAATVVSAYASGALAYEAGTQLIVVDVRGRTDEHIARDGESDGETRTDYDYVVNVRRPAVAVPAAGYTQRQRCGADPAYAGLYEVANFQRAGTDEWVLLYLRRNRAASLIEALGADPAFAYRPCAPQHTRP
ncbi:glycosyltransferase family 39 protein [Prauserella shujinwangii]|uniref:glycosyltransferase family 39 protein n=1 Tax=Prauserella shujinwangii TaxID=1453103 RepID=UPI001FE94C51|nr:glycosyltransferase family 39 protein [Prauserella shujinwangii]